MSIRSSGSGSEADTTPRETTVEIVNMARDPFDTVLYPKRRNMNAVIQRMLLDSAATIHISTTKKGMHDLKTCRKSVDSACKGRSIANEQGVRKFKTSDDTVVSMSETYVLENFLNDIVSLPKLLEKGCSVDHCDSEKIVVGLPDSDQKMVFEKGDDGLFYMEVELVDDAAQVAEVAEVSDDDDDENVSVEAPDAKPKADERVDINRAHELCDHPGETALREQAKAFKWKLTGTLRACDHCSKSKATAKAVPSVSTETTDKPGERLHLDLSGPYKMTRGKNRYHGLLVCQHTSRDWSFFKPEKVDFNDDLDEQFTKMKEAGFPCKFLRLDNAGEWEALRPICAKHGITMEFTAPHTPQLNAKVEREFPTVRNMAYACLMSSGMSQRMQMVHWAHALDDVTILRNLQPRKGFKDAYEPFGEKPPVKPEHLVPFGARGWMTKRNKIKTKWTPKAEEIIRVGYAADHPSDTYLVRKVGNGQYVYSRDIKWDIPRRYRKLNPDATKPEEPEEEDPSATKIATEYLQGNRFEALVSDSEDESETESDAPADVVGGIEQGGRVARELRRLQIGLNQGAPAVEGRTRRSARQQAAVHNIATDTPSVRDPQNDREAMESPEAKHWWDGTVTEYDGFFKLGTWKLVKAKDAKIGAGNKP